MDEFELIRRYFTRPPERPEWVLGIGDDCALLQPAPGQRLAISTDMLVEQRHFFADVDPWALGHKALAVNLSDLAAMGAEPLGFTLALALPSANAAWLERFSQGLLALAQQHRCPLVGGDTTRGPLNLCVTVFGQVPPQQELRRSGAQPGDEVWVSGRLGDARLALEMLLGHTAAEAMVLAKTRLRLEQPTPRVALGQALRGIANAAADLSDGLQGDLGHILKASGVGADLDGGALWHSDACSDEVRALPEALAWECLLNGGDDYELVFTAPVQHRTAVLHAGARSATPVTRIGRVREGHGLHCRDTHGQTLTGLGQSFRHFA